MHAEDFDRRLEAALVTRPALEQAKGILAGVRCVTPVEAYEELTGAARHHGVELDALAGALVEVAAGCRPDDPLLRKVIWQEWGNLLPNCTTD